LDGLARPPCGANFLANYTIFILGRVEDDGLQLRKVDVALLVEDALVGTHVDNLAYHTANCIADKADSIVGCIGRFQWDIAVTRIGQLASEMRLLTGGQSVGGSNGNADELTTWNGTKKRGLGI